MCVENLIVTDEQTFITAYKNLAYSIKYAEDLPDDGFTKMDSVTDDEIKTIAMECIDEVVALGDNIKAQVIVISDGLSGNLMDFDPHRQDIINIVDTPYSGLAVDMEGLCFSEQMDVCNFDDAKNKEILVETLYEIVGILHSKIESVG